MSESLPPLSDYELEELIRLAPRRLQDPIARLCQEVKDLRDQQAAREFAHGLEQEN